MTILAWSERQIMKAASKRNFARRVQSASWLARKGGLLDEVAD